VWKKPISTKKSISTNTRHLLLVVLISAAVIAPAMVFGIPSSRDLSSHFRLAQPFFDGIRSGHLYPGWLAESNSGYGDASFRFYPPGTHYLLAAFRLLSGNWYLGTLLVFTLLSMVGSLGVYFWAREFLPSQNAMWASVFYALAPYHLNQLYQSFLLPEFAGAAVLPFVFLFVERVCRWGAPRDVAGLAISSGALGFTHLPLTINASIALAAYALVRLEHGKKWFTVLRLAFASILGLAASACYWTTMVAELKWIRADNIQPEPSVNYRLNFLLSSFSPENLNVWWMNILLLSSLAMFWPAVACFWSARRVATSEFSIRALKATIVVLALTLFMATPLSLAIWNLLPTLQATQFPWRWLLITSLAGSVLLAAAIPYWEDAVRRGNRKLVMIAAGTIAVSLAFSASHIVREAQWLSRPVFEKTLSEIRGSQGSPQWWPIWVKEPIRNMDSPVEAGGREVTVISWLPELRTFHLGPGAAGEARVRTFFYPHWRAESDGRNLAVRPDSDGALLISVPANALSINLRFQEPPRVWVARVVCVVGWILIGALFFLGARQSMRFKPPSVSTDYTSQQSSNLKSKT